MYFSCWFDIQEVLIEFKSLELALEGKAYCLEYGTEYWGSSFVCGAISDNMFNY